MQVSITQCMSQLRINWEGCGRKGIRRKLVGMMQAEATATQISWHSVGLSAWMPLLALLALSKREIWIPTVVWTAWRCSRSHFVASVLPSLTWDSSTAWRRSACGMCCVLPSGTGSLTRVVLVKGPLKAKFHYAIWFESAWNQLRTS